MTERVLLLCVALALAACATAQFSRGANEYPIEAQGSQPLKNDVVFKTGDPDLERRNKLPEASLVIGIMSAPQNFEQRNAVRASWVQLQSLTDPKLNDLATEEKQKLVIRFVIGTPKEQALEALIAKEFATYHDIVRVPVEEDYFKLTLKTGEFIKWADATYKAKWVMKCDDDSFVRVDKLLRELESQPKDAMLYMGKIWTGTPVDRRIDSFTPWSSYAPFAAGAGYVISWQLASYIHRNWDRLHKYPMEDVAVGMWVSPLRVTYVDHPHFHSFQEGCDRDMIVQNPANPTVMKEVFFHTMNGVPCHMLPDPFDPKNKNITDHVLLQFGIPKPAPGATTTKNVDPMQRFATQTLIELDAPVPNMMIDVQEVDNSMMDTMNGMNSGMNNMNNMNMNEPTKQATGSDEEEEMAEERVEAGFNDKQDGMAQDMMNSNNPSNKSLSDMNRMGHGAKTDAAKEETMEAEKKMNSQFGAGSVVMM